MACMLHEAFSAPSQYPILQLSQTVSSASVLLLLGLGVFLRAVILSSLHLKS